MQPSIPFSYPGIDADVERLGRLLQLSLRIARWSPPGQPAILNLACGRADETGVLLQTLHPLASRLFYLGIDLRPAEIAEARQRWLPRRPEGWDIEFRAGDASRPDRMRQLPPFDLVFIRHQNYWHDPATWLTLYRHALAALKPRGLLAITSYFDREHELAVAAILQLGGHLAANLHHPESRPLPDAPGKSVDRRLALFRPGPSEPLVAEQSF